MAKYIPIKTLVDLMSKGLITGKETEEDLGVIYLAYKRSVKSSFGMSRKELLESELGEDEMELMKDYFENKMSNHDIEKKYGFKENAVYGKIWRPLAKFVYQNRDKLDLELDIAGEGDNEQKDDTLRAL